MFVSHDMKSKKKSKPNILRRKPVLSKSLIVHKPESQNVQSLLAPSFVLDPKSNAVEEQKSENCDDSGCSIEKLVPKVEVSQCNTQEVVENISEHNSLIYFNTIQQNDNEFGQNQTVNIGTLLLGDVINQNVPVIESDPLLENKDKENQARGTWCFIENPETIILKQIDNTDESLIGYDAEKPGNTIEPAYLEEPAQLTKISSIYKCDISYCNEEFVTKQKLKKHMSVHQKGKVGKTQRHTTSECPVKRLLENDVEVPCGRVYLTKEELMKHLNDEHTIDEAFYSCSECGRRFFWASGLRAHSRAHAAVARESLACPWPGCARVFRQPCRLREHARAHTGDRPYPCRYPNCGWSFRTASKLLRHTRRHTGERQHACAACGRAFLRREHLRDHVQRHAAPRARHACPSIDCQQSFSNRSSLYLHMKKVHKSEDKVPLVASTENNEKIRFVVSLLEPSESSSIEPAAVEVKGEAEVLQAQAGEVGAAEEEGHSARTHCTWPLARAPQYQPSDEYVLEEDVPVEQSEGSESNIYTVRSDLFLHGNVLHNEDSEQMAQCSAVSEGEGEGDGDGEVGAPRADALALDADMLLDAPSVHFDQEGLYTDAVDESSFRVFLLSGEELV
ncbi:zinc finger protein 76 [Bicyclus anynana]|uniref:Zinc finger protein 76 n=1 Tax=Bicyclus anynana TaxID=110368 RepID=A0A6J1MSA1_BICAN|nr:zinc finger protein 76 [Bicyclus anynana]XP_023935790.2 zinc finger protein 76 [Bicyclus anynana]XP_023935791.2 zinc finger protein 76 [Bicyclus anynana]XP_023935793.2 zinc finger protein 76 [Bicyclus anynana]XP_052739153.1 zinc finger protein 76 [Bicyclus anynana]